MILHELHHALPIITCIDIQSMQTHEIQVPEPICNIEPGINADFFSNTFYFSYSSLLTRHATCEFNMQSKQLRVNSCITQQHVDYTVQLVQVLNGSVSIPMTILFNKNIPMYA